MNSIDHYQPRAVRRTTQLCLRGIDCAVHEWGDESAPLLIYLHGFADTGGCFQFVADYLATDYRIVAPDWRGFGASGHVDGAYWFPDYIADLHALLDAFSPNEPARLVGHSMGGNVAGLYAGIFPQRVSAFANIEGFGLPEGDAAAAPARYRSWIEAMAADAAWSDYTDYAALAKRIQKRNPSMSPAMARFVAAEWAHDDGNAVRLHADPKHKWPNPVVYRRAEAEACWRGVTAEVLCIAGERSRFRQPPGSASMPFAQCAEVVIADAGHAVHFEQPAELARILGEFLARHL